MAWAVPILLIAAGVLGPVFLMRRPRARNVLRRNDTSEERRALDTELRTYSEGGTE